MGITRDMKRVARYDAALEAGDFSHFSYAVSTVDAFITKWGHTVVIGDYIKRSYSLKVELQSKGLWDAFESAIQSNVAGSQNQWLADIVASADTGSAAADKAAADKAAAEKAAAEKAAADKAAADKAAADKAAADKAAADKAAADKAAADKAAADKAAADKAAADKAAADKAAADKAAADKAAADKAAADKAAADKAAADKAAADKAAADKAAADKAAADKAAADKAAADKAAADKAAADKAAADKAAADKAAADKAAADKAAADKAAADKAAADKAAADKAAADKAEEWSFKDCIKYGRGNFSQNLKKIADLIKDEVKVQDADSIEGYVELTRDAIKNLKEHSCIGTKIPIDALEGRVSGEAGKKPTYNNVDQKLCESSEYQGDLLIHDNPNDNCDDLVLIPLLSDIE